MLVEILVADTTPLRNRLLFSFIPAAPALINAWVSGDVASAVLDVQGPGWRWGFGMWCIIFPICTIPLFFALLRAEFKAKRAGLLAGIPSGPRAMLKTSLWVDIFWQLDIVGLVLIAGFFIMFLLPFTLYGAVESEWKQASAIAPIVVGVVVVLPLWIVWEKYFARHPAFPFRLFKDRQVVACLILACFFNAAWYCQGDYLYYLLQVAFHQDVKHATWISNIYTFVSTFTGICLGFVVRYVHRMKWFVVFGTGLSIVAFGLLIHFRSATHGGLAGLCAGEVLLGLSFGMFTYPGQTLIQSAVQHERVAVVTSLYLAAYSIGNSIGNTIAAGIWINTLPQEATKQLKAFGVSNLTIAQDLYASPVAYVATWPVGTPEREAAIYAYAHTQRLMCIAGICILGLLFIVSWFLRNPYLGETQTTADAEGFVANEPAGPIPALHKEGGEGMSSYEDVKEPREPSAQVKA